MATARTPDQDVDVDIGALFASLLANWVRILVVSLSVTAVAFMLASMATKHYKAETRILIETRESVFTRPVPGSQDDAPLLDEQGVMSQVEVIASTDILKQVAQKLDLAARPEFEADASVSMLDRVLIIVGLKSDPIDIPADERVLKAFREKLAVYRIERSRVIVVEFSSEDPRLAAEVPNAIADAYIALQRDAKLQSNTDATAWLEPEIAALGTKVKQAEGKVADFRAKSDLLVGNNNSALATQQLSELSTELSRVRANRASAEATARSFREALQNGASIEALPGVLASGLVQRLQESRVQLQADIADLSATLLDNHPRLKSLRSQLADLDRQIAEEARKVLRGLETEAETAQLREQELAQSVNRLKAESARVGEEEVELRALEREAAAQRELLESYLARYREAASRKEGNYVPADARVFSRASIPTEPYFPKIVPVTIAAFVASLLLMVIATLLAELFSGRAMRPAVRREVEPVEQIAMPVPSAPAAPIEAPAPVEASQPLPPFPTAEKEPVDPRLAAITDELSIERAAERLIAGGAARALFVSPEGDEGAAVAVLVAREAADAGMRVLLLDLTASGAASRPMLDRLSLPGITDLLCAEAQFADVIHGDLYSDCHVIPVGTANAARAMRAADRLPIILESLNTAYDLVLVECGPADPASIARLAGDATEIVVSVLEPGADHVEESAAALKAAGYDRLLKATPVGYMAPPPVSGRSAA